MTGREIVTNWLPDTPSSIYEPSVSSSMASSALYPDSTYYSRSPSARTSSSGASKVENTSPASQCQVEDSCADDTKYAAYKKEFWDLLEGIKEDEGLEVALLWGGIAEKQSHDTWSKAASTAARQFRVLYTDQKDSDVASRTETPSVSDESCFSEAPEAESTALAPQGQEEDEDLSTFHREHKQWVRDIRAQGRQAGDVSVFEPSSEASVQTPDQASLRQVEEDDEFSDDSVFSEELQAECTSLASEDQEEDDDPIDPIIAAQFPDKGTQWLQNVTFVVREMEACEREGTAFPAYCAPFVPLLNLLRRVSREAGQAEQSDKASVSRSEEPNSSDFDSANANDLEDRHSWHEQYMHYAIEMNADIPMPSTFVPVQDQYTPKVLREFSEIMTEEDESIDESTEEEDYTVEVPSGAFADFSEEFDDAASVASRASGSSAIAEMMAAFERDMRAGPARGPSGAIVHSSEDFDDAASVASGASGSSAIAKMMAAFEKDIIANHEARQREEREREERERAAAPQPPRPRQPQARIRTVEPSHDAENTTGRLTNILDGFGDTIRNLYAIARGRVPEPQPAVPQPQPLIPTSQADYNSEDDTHDSYTWGTTFQLWIEAGRETVMTRLGYSSSV